MWFELENPIPTAWNCGVYVYKFMISFITLTQTAQIMNYLGLTMICHEMISYGLRFCFPLGSIREFDKESESSRSDFVSLKKN